MQSKPNHVFLELLKFPSVELFQSKGKDPIGLYQGPLQVIYSSQLELVLLKLGNNKLSLNTSLPVIGAFSGKEKLPAFLIPTFDGFYMIRILDSNPGVVLTNFETILESTCEFYRRTDLEQKLGDIKESKIGAFKEVIQKAKEAILPTHERHPNYRLIRTYDELLNVDSTSVPVIDISAKDVENIQSETDEVIRNHLSNKHWIDFSHQEGVPTGSYIKGPVLKTLRTTLQPVEQSRPRAGSIGADNIASIKTETGFDSQEVVGTENQRLPAYEVQWTKEQVAQGLASCDKEFCPIPKRKTQETEDESLTCDLMRPKGSRECMGQGNEPVPILASTAGRENLEFRPPVSEKERRNIPEQAISKENLPSGQIA